MSPLTKAKARIKRLERCLQDIANILAERSESLERFSGDDDSQEQQTISHALNRINRSLYAKTSPKLFEKF